MMRCLDLDHKIHKHTFQLLRFGTSIVSIVEHNEKRRTDIIIP